MYNKMFCQKWLNDNLWFWWIMCLMYWDWKYFPSLLKTCTHDERKVCSLCGAGYVLPYAMVCCLGSETDGWAGRWMDARLEHVLRARNVSTRDEWKIQILFFKFISPIIASRIMRVADRWCCVVGAGERGNRGQIESIKIRITPGRLREWCEERRKITFD